MVPLTNQQLASQIISSAEKKDIEKKGYELGKTVKEICSSEAFLQDPVDCMIHLLIKKSLTATRRQSEKDEEKAYARAFVLGRIPGFIESVVSIDHLKELAQKDFSGSEDTVLKTMKFFNEWLENPQFQNRLARAKSAYAEGKFKTVESSLRTAMLIFPQSQKFQTYEESTYKSSKE